MKEFTRKAVVILVLAMLMLNSSIMLVISTAIDAVHETIEKSKINSNIEINLQKYVNYVVDESNKGLLLQTNVKSGIEYEKDQKYNAIKSTEIVVNSPKIEEEYPESVEVVTKSTKATNGDEKGKDTQVEYNKDNGKVKIIVNNNENEEGKIYNDKIDGARDEFEVIYYYSKNCYNSGKIERTLNFAGKIQEILADEDSTKIEKDFSKDNTVTENISGLISTEVTTSDIYNGFINSNKQNGTQNETEFTENIKIESSYKNISDEVTIQTENKFKNTNNDVLDTNDIIYKSTKIKKDEVLKELGENGKLQILNTKGEVLGEINKDTETSKDGFVEINYENQPTEIVIKASKLNELGTINIENKKAIKKEMTEINNNKIQTKNLIKCLNNIQEKNEETQEVIREYQKEVYNFENNKEIEIKQSSSRIDLTVDKTQWTNSIQNDVNFKLTLLTNDAKYNLYKNPTIEIALPDDVEKVILGETSTLYDNGLNLQSTELVEKNGKKIINIKLSGMQTQYTINGAIDGTTILLPATIIMKKDIESKDSNLELTYTNETGIVNDYVQEEKTNKEIGIQIDSINDENEENKPRMLMQVAQQQAEITEGLDIQVKAQVGNKVLTNGDTVYEKQVIKYVVTAKNTTDKDITNISIKGQVPDGTTYGTIDKGTYIKENYEYIKDETKKQYDFQISFLKAGESKEEFYEVVVNDLAEAENEKNIVNNITTKVNSKDYNTQSLNNVIKKAELNVFLKSYIGRDEKNSFCYWIDVENLTDRELTNVKLESSEFMKEMSFKSAVLYSNGAKDIGEYKENKYTAVFDKINAKETKEIVMVINAGNFDKNVNVCDLFMSMKVSGDSIDTYYSNENIRTAYPEYVTVTQTLDKEGEEVLPGTELSFTVNIKNNSKIPTEVNIVDFLPDKIEGTKAEYEEYIMPEEYEEDEDEYGYDSVNKDILYEREKNTINITGIIVDQEKNELGNMYIDTVIPAEKELTIKFKARARFVSKAEKQSNYISITGESIESVISNVVSFTVVPVEKDQDIPTKPDDPVNPDDPTKPDDPTNPDNPNDEEKLKNISGMIWIDKNDNGKRDSGERGLQGIVIKLYNADTNSIVLDNSNNKQIKYTDENGIYNFSEVKKGNYLVLVEYDSNKYSLAKYQFTGVDEKVNSDVIKKNVSIDGVEKNVGVTDVLTISDKDIKNIDTGLIENKKYDLSLKKYVSKITVENAEGKKEYSYENEQLAKIEIPSKQINNTNVNIEYKIVVTNEGNTKASVSEIIDYLPEGLELDDINGKWTEKEDGKIINTSLSGIQINPGENKEITLKATKEMTAENTGTFINSAEILKINNLENIRDNDSIEGNKNSKEDDYSEATVIISIKTGLIKNFLIIILLCMILIVIELLIKKCNNKSILKCIIILAIAGIAITPIISEATLYGEKTDINIKGPPGGPFKDENGTKYTCMDPGWGQCQNGNHYYKKYKEKEGKWIYDSENIQDIAYKTSESEVSYVKYKRDEDGKEYYQVGPFKIKTNIPIEFESASVNYETNPGNVDANGNRIEYYGSTSERVVIPETLEDEKYGFMYSVYFNLIPLDVIEITDISMECSTDTTTKEIKKHMYTRKYYNCVGVEGCSNLEHSDNPNIVQRMKRRIRVDGTETTTSKISVDFDDIDNSGLLEIFKKDTDTQGWAPGAKFRVTGTVSGYRREITLSEGWFYLYDLPRGPYVVEEIGAPTGYNLSLQAQTNIVQNPNIGAEKVNVTFYNTQYGSLIIRKIDDGDILLPGVKFQIIRNGQYIRGYTNQQNQPCSIWWTNEQWEQVTDVNGQIALQNIPVGIYHIKETAISKDMEGYYDEKNLKEFDVIVEANETRTEVVINKQKYVDVAGSVFEDIGNGKSNEIDGVYNENEKHIAGITVNLLENGAIVDSRRTDGNGQYSFKLEIAKLSSYNIEFEYNGLKYENTSVRTDIENVLLGSKAKEKQEDRNALNNSFDSVVNSNGERTKGKAGNYNLTYNSGEHTSTLVEHTSYSNTVGRVEYTNAEGENVYPLIKADTRTGGYNWQETWKTGIKLIPYVDFGLKARAMPDMSLSATLDNITLTTGAYKETYTYKDGINKDGVRNYTSSIYRNYLLASEINMYATYKINIINEGSLRMSANKITSYYDTNYYDTSNIKSWNDGENESNSITWEEDGTGKLSTTGLEDIEIEPKGNKIIFLKIKIKIDKNITDPPIIKNTFEISSYSTYREPNKYYAGIDKDSAPGNIILGNTYTYEDDTEGIAINMRFNESRTIRGNVFEDKAVSNNAGINTKNLMTGQERVGNGQLDNNENKIKNVKVKLIRIDDRSGKTPAYIYGKDYSDTYKKIAEVYTNKNGEYEFVGVIPGKYEIEFTYGNESIIIDKDGNEGEKTTTQNYKSTVIKNDVIKKIFKREEKNNFSWYKDNDDKYSVALDSESTRNEINRDLQTINYSNEINYQNKGVTKQTIVAQSPTLEITFENAEEREHTTESKEFYIVRSIRDWEQVETNAEGQIPRYENINFGIIERPRQSLKIEKRISHVKLTLANGQEIVNGNPLVDKLRYVTYPPNGDLKIELDNELMQGATLDVVYSIKVTNNSELDYNCPDYYNYGIATQKEKDETMVRTTINSLADYMDENLKTSYIGNEGDWISVKAKKVGNISTMGDKPISPDVYNEVKNYNNILLAEGYDKFKDLVPNNERTIEVSASKLLSSEDDATFKNNVELIEVTNPVGRFYGYMKSGKWTLATPGNYTFEESTSECDNDDETLKVVPSTGQKRIYYILGITSSITLVAGIYLIKKKVL